MLSVIKKIESSETQRDFKGNLYFCTGLKSLEYVNPKLPGL
jgi:hypothetical protein